MLAHFMGLMSEGTHSYRLDIPMDVPYIPHVAYEEQLYRT